MKTQFETEKEAKTALKNANSENLGWCPLIKDVCVKHVCVCYYAGDIHHQKPKQFRQFDAGKEYWFVHYPCCTNVLISGEFTVHVEY